MTNICIVIPDADYSLAGCMLSHACHLQKKGFLVSFLCYRGAAIDYLGESCVSRGFPLIRINNLDDVNLSLKNIPFLISYKVYQLLSAENFDTIIFSDFMGFGYHCVQAKRTMNIFAGTRLTVMMYSATQFVNELTEDWGSGGVEQLMVQFMERYCCEFCDALLSHSHFLFEWAEARRWRLCTNRYVILPQYISGSNKIVPINIDHLIFWGELSKREGLHLLIGAVYRLNSQNNNPIKKISFLGKPGIIEGKDTQEYVDNILQGIPITCNFIHLDDPTSALEYARTEGGIFVFCPSISGGVFEFFSVLGDGAPIIASRVGANLEYLDEAFTFPPSIDGLGNILCELSEIDFSAERTIDLDGVADLADIVGAQYDPIARTPTSFLPKVSICMAYYNHAKYLEMVLDSIDRSTYENYEVIIINDGSTDTDSNEVFERIKAARSDDCGKVRYIFHTKPNEGPSIARNMAAVLSNGEYLLFVDSDNLIKPDMIKTFVDGIYYSKCCCLSCYFHRFEGHEEPSENNVLHDTYAILGPSPENAIFTNCLGDTNFIIKKEVFMAIGGFLPQRIVTEDWHILSKLIVGGYKMDTIPAPIFWYRVLPMSNVSFGSYYYKELLIMNVFSDNLPSYVFHIFNSLCRPSLSPPAPSSNNVGIYSVLKVFFDRLFPYDSKRRNIFKKILLKVVRLLTG